MSFKTNDRIRVKENGFRATVKGVSFNSIHQEWEYYVVWDNFPSMGEICYTAWNVDGLWEKIAEIKDAMNVETATGKDLDRLALPYGIMKKECDHKCDHKWVNASLQFEKMCCYHCGVDKP